jgi:hypothetical protein
MADKDELVGSDELTNKLTEPSQKVTYQDYWNRAYGGLLPAGLNRKGDSSAPTLPEGNDDAEPFSETPVTVVQPEEVKRPDAMPVVVLDDLTRVAGSVEHYFRGYQIQVPSVGTTRIVNHDPRRARVRIANFGPNTIFIGDTESVGNQGYQLSGIVLEINTTREVWAIQNDTPAPSGPAIVNILVEYDKEI